MKLALRLEAENPQLGQPGTPAAGSGVGRDVQVIVNGGQPNIAIASSGVTQTSTFMPGDRAGLFAHLRALGIEDDQLAELDDALNEDATDAEVEDTTKKRPGSRVLGWVGSLAMTAGTAASSTAGQEAAKAIGHYMGQI